MSPAQEPKLRFSDTAYAIGSTPKALRNWLQRGHVTLVGSHDGGWREFSYGDVAVLAVVRQFVNFGIGVQQANDLAHSALAQMSKDFAGQASALTLLFPKTWAGQELLVWIELEKELWKSRVVRKPIANQPYQSRRNVPPAYITLDMEKVLQIAFDRAHESVTDGSADDDEN